MKRIIMVFLCILLLSSSFGCGGSSGNEKKSPADLEKGISAVLAASDINDAQKALKIIPFMIDKAASWNDAAGGIVVTEEYQWALQGGVDFLKDKIIKGGLSDAENQEFITAVNVSLSKENFSPNKLEIYGFLFAKAASRLPAATLTKNPDLNIGKWKDAEIKRALEDGEQLFKLYNKLKGNEAVLAAFTEAVEKPDPLATMAMWVKAAEKNDVHFPSSLMERLADSTLKVLSYSQFFDGKAKNNFYKAFPQSGDTVLAMHLLRIKSDDRAAANVAIYSKMYPAAKSLLEDSFTPEFAKIFTEYQAYCDSQGIILTADTLIHNFPALNYSTFSAKELLRTPQDATSNTYILSMNPKGNKQVNWQGDNYKLFKKFLDKEGLQEAPLEYAKYLITVSTKLKKTNFYFKGTKPRQWVYRLSGTVMIYDRVTGSRVAKLDFASPKVKKGQSLIPELYAKPSINLVPQTFYDKLSAEIAKLR